jgi:hypothetical protein
VTTRRLGILVLACVLLGVALTLGLQGLTSGGVPIQPAATATVSASISPGRTNSASVSPSAKRSTLGLPDHDRTPGAINAAATQDNLATTVCKSGWSATVRPPSAYTSALKIAQIV